jgi:hypothetical protein
MTLRLLRSLLALLALLVLGACASKPAPTDKPVLRKIALIPAVDPQRLTLSNENGVMNVLVPIASVGFLLDSKEKAKRFNEAMAGRRVSYAAKLTTTVVDALRGAGYKVEVLDALERPADDPDDIDYEKLKTDAEMILQLRVDEVGVYSSKLSPDYLPRVNVQAKLYVRSRDDSLYDETLYFGVDAKPGKEFTIVSDPKFAYPSFDAVLARSDEIGGVFESGTDALARMLAAQLIEVLATKTRPAP